MAKKPSLANQVYALLGEFLPITEQAIQFDQQKFINLEHAIF